MSAAASFTEDELPPEGAPPTDVMAAIGEAARVAQSVAAALPTTLTLSNGVQLYMKAVPPLAMRQASIQIPEPVVPIVLTEDGREIPNPNDPEYTRNVLHYLTLQAARLADVMILLGSSLKEVPEGIEKPTDTNWQEMLKIAGIPLSELDLQDSYHVYLAWLRFYALPTEEDIANLIQGITALSGVTENEVVRAARAFRYTT